MICYRIDEALVRNAQVKCAVGGVFTCVVYPCICICVFKLDVRRNVTK